MRESKSRRKLLARLDGTVILSQRNVPLKYSVRDPALLIGRSDPAHIDTNPFRPAKSGVHVGLGISNKLSRAHARIEHSPPADFAITCLGKNGLSVTTPQAEFRLTHTSDPVPLPDGAVVKIADCVFTFSIPGTKKRSRREWIKSEHLALRTNMMRLGYGRWDEIINATNGRLSERQPSELIPVARKFVAMCYIHARPGVEQKALMQILRRPLADGVLPASDDIDALIEAAREEADENEKRKYVRWARKLRLLSRLQDVHDHRSLEQLRVGKLRVFTPPPALYWTSADDADLIIGSYKHGYGATEAIRTDPELGFAGRYSKAPSVKKCTPMKKAEVGSEEEEEDDEDPDEDEDDRNAMSIDDDEENGGEGVVHNPKKRLKLGDRTPKKEDVKMEDVNNSQNNGNVTTPNENAMEDSDMSPVDAKEESTPVKPEKSTPEKVKEEGTEVKKKRMVPKRGPRIGNEDGFNEPEDAKAAAVSNADENGLVPFPNSEALMRRLKSTINSCAKEFDRDQREFQKRELAASRAKQRKDDLAARKAEKEAEKTRQRAERRIAKSQPFSKKEAVEFERGLSNFGVVYKADGKTVDWPWFHSKVEGFEAKYAETLEAAYLELLSEAHRINDLAAAKEDEDFEAVDRINDQKKASKVFSTLTGERAEKLIERLEFFRALRGEVLLHPKLASILRGFKKTKDLPVWWKSSHDKSLLIGVDKHGLNGLDVMGVDSDLVFASSMKAWQRKNANDVKSQKRAAMPKSSAGIKRAFSLVRYFRSRANDPHFELYSRDEVKARAAGEEAAGNALRTKAEIKEEALEEKPLVQLLRRTTPGSAKPKRKTESVLVPQTGAGGRPRTLRQTLIKIPKDENGILILPADLGDGLFLLSLGEVLRGAPNFCNNGIIFPVGLRTIRQMGSDAFLCEILASQDKNHPEFRVSALDGFNDKAEDEDTMWSGQRIIATSRNLVTLWMRVVNEEIAKDAQNPNRVNLSSGPERFGLYEPTIVYQIQKLPGAKFVEGFHLRDFSHRGGGALIEPSVGVLDAMLKAIEAKLEPRDERHAYDDDAVSDDEDNQRVKRLIQDHSEMKIPEEWILEHSFGKKKHSRRRSSSYWG